MSSYPANPNYGHGAYRRRVALHNTEGVTRIQMEDCNHGFVIQLQHDGERITRVQAEALRYPLSSCPGATTELEVFVDTPLAAQPTDLFHISSPKQHCTHLYDMLRLGIAHALRDTPERIYDVEVPDFKEGVSTATVFRDGQRIHHWAVDFNGITEPESLNGKPLFKGFSQWSQAVFAGDELEAAFVLQMGFFVARARMYDMSALDGQPADVLPVPLGVCYSHQEERIAESIRMPGSTRDFSDTPEQLLRFV